MKYVEEKYAKNLHFELTQRLVGDGTTTVTVEGDGVHWECTAQRGVRRCSIACFGGGGPEYLTAFESQAKALASARTSSDTQTLDAVEEWLKGSPLCSLYERFPFCAVFGIWNKTSIFAVGGPMQNKFKHNHFLALPLVALPLLASGLSAIAQPAVTPKASLGKRSVKAGSWVDLQVSTSKRRYASGEPIPVTLKATNIQEKDAYLKFSSGQRFDFQVFKIGEKEPVYSWSATRMFAQMTGALKLKMAQRETYTAAIGDEMGQLKPGNYRLEAHLTNSSQVRALPIDFTIVAEVAATGTTATEKRATLTARTDKRVY